MSEVLSKNIALNLKRLREARQVSQQRLSDASGVPRPTLANLESGAANPTLSLVLKVSEALNVQLEELLRQPEPAILHHPAADFPKPVRAQLSIQRLAMEATSGISFERIQLKPKARWNIKPAAAGQRYHLYCECGAVRITAAGESCRLAAGDVAVLRSEVGCLLTNDPKRSAVLFRVVTPIVRQT